jgi:hypothetical protein
MDINYKLDKQGIEQMKHSLKIYTQIQEMNTKNTMKLIERTQEADNQIMELLQVGLKRLSHVQEETIANLLLELHKGLEIQKITAQRNMLELSVTTTEGALSVQKSIRENGEAMEKALHDLSKLQIEGFGTIKTNMVTLLGQLEATAKVTESIKPQLGAVKNDMERELLKIDSLIEKLKLQIEFETQMREKALAAETKMRDAQISLEIANRQEDVLNLYDTIYEEKQGIYEYLEHTELETNVQWLIEQNEEAYRAHEYLEGELTRLGSAVNKFRRR